MIRILLASLLALGLSMGMAQEEEEPVFEDYTVVEYTVEWIEAVGEIEEGPRAGRTGRGWDTQVWLAEIYRTTTVYTYDAETEEYVVLSEETELVDEGEFTRYRNPGGQWADGRTLSELDYDEETEEE